MVSANEESDLEKTTMPLNSKRKIDTDFLPYPSKEIKITTLVAKGIENVDPMSHASIQNPLTDFTKIVHRDMEEVDEPTNDFQLNNSVAQGHMPMVSHQQNLNTTLESLQQNIHGHFERPILGSPVCGSIIRDRTNSNPCGNSGSSGSNVAVNSPRQSNVYSQKEIETT